MEETNVSALSLMMGQADEIYSGVAGQPKPSKDETHCEENFSLLREDIAKLYNGSDASSAVSNVVTDNSIHKNNIINNNGAPCNEDLEEAFEQYFSLMDKGFGSVVKSIRDETSPLDKMTDTLAQWFDWTRKRAFAEDNKHREEEGLAAYSGTDLTDVGGGGEGGGGGSDIYGGRERKTRKDKGRRRGPNSRTTGRDRDRTRTSTTERRRRPPNPTQDAGDTSNRRRQNSRTRPGPTPPPPPRNEPKLRGKAAIFGAALTGAALFGGTALGYIQKKLGEDRVEGGNSGPNGITQVNPDVSLDPITSPTPTQTSQQAPTAPANTSPRPMSPSELAEHKKDMAEHNAAMDEWDQEPDGIVKTITPNKGGAEGPINAENASTAMMGAGMLAGAARLPGIGTALQVGSGALDMYGISQDDSLSKSDKAGQMAGAATSTATSATGAVIGGIIGTALIPIPGVGTIIGSLAGSFLGSLAGDKLSENVSEYVSTKIVVETEAAISEADKERDKANKKEEQAKLADMQLLSTGTGGVGTFANMFGLGSSGGEGSYSPSAGPGRRVMSSNFASLSPGNTKLASGNNYDNNLSALRKGMQDAGITDPTEMAVFLGQMDHESGGMKSLTENLNYGAKGYMATFGGRNGIKTEAQAQAVISQGKEAQAEAMYGGEWGKRNLGNSEQGDGYKYRGRGFTQLTGRSNYARAGKALGVDLLANPDLASEPELAAKIATWYWQDREGLAEAGKRGDVETTTKKINGGQKGLADRKAKTALYAANIKSGKFNIKDGPMAVPADSEVAVAKAEKPDLNLAPVETQVAKSESIAEKLSMEERPADLVSRTPLAKADPQSMVPTMLQAPAPVAEKKERKPAPNLAMQPPSHRGSSGNAAVPSLDGIPVMIDDPIMGMLNIGYI